MSRKVRVGILFGGRSAEHEVSLQSARSVLNSIDRTRFEPVLIGIDRSGRWYLQGKSLESDEGSTLPNLSSGGPEVALYQKDTGGALVAPESGGDLGDLDIVFPVLHGPYGEDGTVQGLLKLANIPFVGADVLGSAIGMDKDVMKRLLRDADIPIAAFRVLRNQSDLLLQAQNAIKDLRLPAFVKPANLGSSVGVEKVSTLEEATAAAKNAFRYDTKVLVEECIDGREIECAVLGTSDPLASIPGEIKPLKDFYSYNAKYLDEHGAELIIPAPLDPDVIARVRNTAIKTFEILCCSGMARVDMFLTPKNQIVVNEINTIPGFTKISMYPKLWEATGIGYTNLISRLIDLGFERYEAEKNLLNSQE
ncbi:MAG: D-alanine--D-alanine ligase [Spirochaetales bacterium]|jgi:D-alanine-D-alanine ligase|nr:D-alanine--D-alanine ligase [Spirochaetales bacterium]